MKLLFRSDKIEVIREGNVERQITLQQLKDDSENNLLFNLLEICVREDIENISLHEDALPYIKKLYEIFKDEFYSDDLDF